MVGPLEDTEGFAKRSPFHLRGKLVCEAKAAKMSYVPMGYSAQVRSPMDGIYVCVRNVILRLVL